MQEIIFGHDLIARHQSEDQIIYEHISVYNAIFLFFTAINA